jgi:hypothetical protein
MRLRGLTRRRWIGLALAVLPLVVATVLVAVGRQPQRFAANGIQFEVPSTWRIHDHLPPTTGTGQELAIIGTMPWGPCDEIDINCHFRERLNRDEIEVHIGVSSLLGSDFCAYAHDRPDMERSDGVRVMETHYIRIDDRPAISTTYSLDSPDYYLSDGWKTWKIAPADTTEVMYGISARWRGPGDDEFLAALDQLVASIKLGPSGYAVANIPDCGAPFPVATK